MNFIRIALCALLAFAVLSYGAVEVWSQSILEIGAAALFLLWSILQFRDAKAVMEWNPLNLPFLGFIGVGFLQWLLRATAYAFLTRVDLLRLAAYFLLFFLFAQAFRKRPAIEAFCWFLVILSFLISLFGIAQYFTSNGKIYWVQALAIPSEFFGPYVNRDHFAGFVELTMPTGLALIAFRGVRREAVPVLTILAVVPLSAIALSGSRSGLIVAAVQILLLLGLSQARGGANRRGWGAVGLVALAAGALIAWVGFGQTIKRFSGTSPQSIAAERRISMARGALHIFADHPIKGSGLGTLVDVYPRYETRYDGRIIDHVHNDYIEALAETGLAGALCGAAFLWLLFREARRSFAADQGHFSRAFHGGAIVAVAGLLIHSLVDFNLHIPANALLFLMQASLATSSPLPGGSGPSRGERR